MRNRWLALVAVVLVAGCGGGSSATYAVGPTQLCLRGQSVHVNRASRNLQYFWFSAPEGALNAKLSGNAVTIDFEQTKAAAESTKSAYEAAAPASTAVEDHGNTVVIWRHAPTSAQRSTVKDCLSK